MPQVVAGVSYSPRRNGPSGPPVSHRTPSSVRVRIPIAAEADVALAAEHGRRLAARLDFSPADVTVITTAIVEVARNVLKYARRGDVMLHLIQQRSGIGIRFAHGVRYREER